MDNNKYTPMNFYATLHQPSMMSKRYRIVTYFIKGSNEIKFMAIIENSFDKAAGIFYYMPTKLMTGQNSIFDENTRLSDIRIEPCAKREDRQIDIYNAGKRVASSFIYDIDFTVNSYPCSYETVRYRGYTISKSLAKCSDDKHNVRVYDERYITSDYYEYYVDGNNLNWYNDALDYIDILATEDRKDIQLWNNA